MGVREWTVPLRRSFFKRAGKINKDIRGLNNSTRQDVNHDTVILWHARVDLLGRDLFNWEPPQKRCRTCVLGLGSVHFMRRGRQAQNILSGQGDCGLLAARVPSVRVARQH